MNSALIIRGWSFRIHPTVTGESRATYSRYDAEQDRTVYAHGSGPNPDEAAAQAAARAIGYDAGTHQATPRGVLPPNVEWLTVKDT